MMDELQVRGVEASRIHQPVEVPYPSSIGKEGPGFGELLRGAIEAVNHMQHESGRLEDAVAKGENMNIHQAIIAGEKAGLSFRLMMQMRNKLLEAYQEVLRMQV